MGGKFEQVDSKSWQRRAFKPGSHLCDKHNTSDISISISTRKKEHVPFFLCLCLCLCRLCYAYRTSVNQALVFGGTSYGFACEYVKIIRNKKCVVTD